MLIVAIVIFMMIMFFGLIFLLRRIMTQNVSLATRHIEELNQDYEKKEEEVSKRLEEVKQKSQDLMRQAEEDADKKKNEIIKEAEVQRDNFIKQARSQSEEMVQQAEKSRQALLTEMESRISREAVHKSCELIRYVLPEQFLKDVHSHWVEDLIQNGLNELTSLKVTGDDSEVKITSAFSLTENERARLSKRLSELLGEGKTFKEEIDPKVVAGLIISIGSLVLDGSLKFKIEEKAKQIQNS